MIKTGFEIYDFDNCVYFKLKYFSNHVYLLLYIYDKLIACNNYIEI